jgi:hypothetical protein
MSQVSASTIVVVLIGVLACCFFGCRGVAEDEIAGRYVFEADLGSSTLILYPDHSMLQKVQPKQGDAKKIVGTWTFDKGFLYTKPCLLVPRDSRNGWIDDCGNAVEIIGSNSIEISVDPDAGLAYQKAR